MGTSLNCYNNKCFDFSRHEYMMWIKISLNTIINLCYLWETGACRFRDSYPYHVYRTCKY